MAKKQIGTCPRTTEYAAQIILKNKTLAIRSATCVADTEMARRNYGTRRTLGHRTTNTTKKDKIVAVSGELQIFGRRLVYEVNCTPLAKVIQPEHWGLLTHGLVWKEKLRVCILCSIPDYYTVRRCPFTGII